MSPRKHFIRAFIFALPIACASIALGTDITGPSSSQSPYLVCSQPGVVIASVLTVGDSVNTKSDSITPYRMVGIPDGLGAFDNGDETFTLLMNHELTGNRGVVRDHGLAGAFVSKWTIEKSTLRVLHGEDLIKHAYQWDTNTFSYQTLTNPLSRLCSADLAQPSAFYNRASGLGYNGRIFMNGEESGLEGRAFAHFMNGNSYELPALGKFAWENTVANPGTGDRTVVAGMDDGTGGQVYIFVGHKSNSTNPIEAAGLAQGRLYGIKVPGFPVEDASAGLPAGSIFTAVDLGDVSQKSGAQLEADSTNALVTTFLRPEDGCWDPMHPNDFYFVTTASFTGRSRLWRLRFANPANPVAGGRIEMLLDGTEGPKMMDNITITRRGSIMIQEDPGNQSYIAKVWRYSIARDTIEMVAQHDPARFTPGAAGFLTQDEESSGIIPMDDILGEGWFLLSVQAHYATDAELVESGQLNALHFPPGREK